MKSMIIIHSTCVSQDEFGISMATTCYTMIVHKAKEGGYWGEIVGLPGCVAQGESIKELKANMQQALDSVHKQGSTAVV